MAHDAAESKDTTEQTIAREAIYCPRCDYDLSALTGPKCPECGQTYDPQTLRQAQMPWAYRREIGGFRALCRTVWVVSVKPGRFSREVARPVDLREALRFRRTIVWLAFGILPAVAAVYFVSGDWHRGDFAEPFGWPLVIMEAVAGIVLSWLCFYALTGVHTYWFHPRHLSIEQQNRTLALSYYASAPLVLVVPCVLILVGVAVGAVSGLWPSAIVMPVSWVAGALGAVAVMAFWRTCLSMARHAAGRGAVGLVVMGVALPLVWAALLALMLGVIPVALAYVWGILHTL
jgi:hypothetical protein